VELGFQTGNPVQGEWRAIWPDGSVHWILGRWQVFKDTTGQPIRMTGVNIDITSRKEAEQAQRRLAAIVEASDDAIIGKDLNGIVISWNPAAERMYGYSSNEMVGQSITTVIPPELQDEERKILETVGRGDRIEHYETVRVTRGGERIDVSLTISPVRDESGKVIGAAKIARDITQQKKTEQSLRTTERLASVGRLAATVAHEINNPLEAVTNLVYLAQGIAVRDDVREYLRQIEEELNRISHITKQTLGFYRETMFPSAVRVGEMLDPLISVFGTRARNKRIEIRTEIRQDPQLYAIAGEIRQLIANLLSNSIDAVSSGGLVRIRVDATRFKGQDSLGTRITVADSGYGIPSSIRTKLFEPFFTTKKDVGTGLGLWVCKNIVERHHGSIRMKSSTTPGRSWTVFSVFLPSGQNRPSTTGGEL
jgi:PAS domain S-box-containing protein